MGMADNSGESGVARAFVHHRFQAAGRTVQVYTPNLPDTHPPYTAGGGLPGR